MRARGIDSRDSVAQIEKRDFEVPDGHAAPFAQRHALQVCNSGPAHWTTTSRISGCEATGILIGSICTNCVGLTGAFRSSQASLESAFAFCSLRSRAFFSLAEA